MKLRWLRLASISSETIIGSGLDFYLPDLDIYIEVKQFHSDRIAKQMARRPNVIAIQGRGAVLTFCAMLKGPKVNVQDI